MIEPNQLLQTYIRQYQAASKKKRKTSSRPRDLSERTNRLFKTLKRTKPTQVTSLSHTYTQIVNTFQIIVHT